MKVGDIIKFRDDPEDITTTGVIVKVAEGITHTNYGISWFEPGYENATDIIWFDKELEKVETDLTPEQYKFMLML